MFRSILAVLSVVTLSILSGCATESSHAARRAIEPFPSVVNLAGDFDHPPKARFIPRTVYPPFLIAQGVTGSAAISFKSGASGYVEEAHVESATEPAFGASALSAVGRMVFSPATKDGVAVPFTGTAMYTFTLE